MSSDKLKNYLVRLKRHYRYSLFNVKVKINKYATPRGKILLNYKKAIYRCFNPYFRKGFQKKNKFGRQWKSNKFGYNKGSIKGARPKKKKWRKFKSRRKLQGLKVKLYRKALFKERVERMRKVTTIFIGQLKEILKKQKSIRSQLNARLKNIIVKTILQEKLKNNGFDEDQLKIQLEKNSDIKTLNIIQNTIKMAADRQLKQLKTKIRLSLQPVSVKFSQRPDSVIRVVIVLNPRETTNWEKFKQEF
ncbi:hypothetical protein ACTFIU_002009 [Dictyostelium citrinum]